VRLLYLMALSTTLLIASDSSAKADVTISKLTKCDEVLCSKTQSDQNLYFYDVKVDINNLKGNQIWKSKADAQKLATEQSTRIFLKEKKTMIASSQSIHGFIAIQQREGIHGDSYISDQWVAADWNEITGYTFDQWITYGYFDFAWDENRPYVYPSLEACEDRLSKDFADDRVNGYTREKLLVDYEAASAMSAETLDDTYKYARERFAIGHPYYGHDHNYDYTKERREHFRCEPLTTAAALKEKMDNEENQYRGTGIYNNIDKLFEEIGEIRDVMNYPPVTGEEVTTYEIHSLFNN